MERTLNQEEIDSLFRSARGLRAGAVRRPRQFARCDFRQAGQLTREQARVVGGLHESFARNLGHVLGAHLRTHVETTLVAIEQLGFDEFTQRLPEICYVASLGVRPIGVSAAMQIDLSLAYPMIDLVLGGNGSAMHTGSEVTEIEEQILESLILILTRELQQVWQPVLDLRFNFEHRQPMAQILRLMPPHEKVLALSFEVRLPETVGMLNLAFPAVISTGLLRKLSESPVYHRRQEESDIRPRMRQRLMNAPFQMELVLPPFRVAIRELLEMQPGQVMKLAYSTETPAVLKAAGRPLCQAQAIRRGHARAAQLETAPRLSRPEGGR
ncbi:MAG TPA: FliM/FliN family flagellar motor switch protein [Terriglobales bacterium]|jgi:flagellar motor switch protein FliM